MGRGLRMQKVWAHQLLQWEESLIPVVVLHVASTMRVQQQGRCSTSVSFRSIWHFISYSS